MDKIERPEYIDDTKRIQKIVKKATGFDISLSDAEQLWLRYSDGMCAGWMILPKKKDEDVYACLNIHDYMI